jgi:hypothetical protein
MKKFALIVFAILAFGFCEHALVAASADRGVCRNKNVFLLGFEKDRVHIYKTPQFDSDSCGTEWEQFGTCCEPRSLERYVQKDTGSIKHFLDQLVTEINMKEDMVRQFVSRVNSLKETLEETDSAKAGQALQNIDSWSSEMNDFLDLIHTTRNDFRHVQTQCAKKMNELRTSSVCSTCSGRSEVFFMHNRAILTDQTCQLFIAECFEAWTMLTGIFRGIYKGQEIVEAIESAGIQFESPYKGPAVKKMQEWLTQIKLETSLNECNGSASGCDEDSRKKICESVLNLEQATYLENTLGFMLHSRANVTSDELRSFKSQAKSFDINKASTSWSKSYVSNTLVNPRTGLLPTLRLKLNSTSTSPLAILGVKYLINKIGTFVSSIFNKFSPIRSPIALAVQKAVSIAKAMGAAAAAVVKARFPRIKDVLEQANSLLKKVTASGTAQKIASSVKQGLQYAFSEIKQRVTSVKFAAKTLSAETVKLFSKIQEKVKSIAPLGLKIHGKNMVDKFKQILEPIKQKVAQAKHSVQNGQHQSAANIKSRVAGIKSFIQNHLQPQKS